MGVDSVITLLASDDVVADCPFSLGQVCLLLGLGRQGIYSHIQFFHLTPGQRGTSDPGAYVAAAKAKRFGGSWHKKAGLSRNFMCTNASPLKQKDEYGI